MRRELKELFIERDDLVDGALAAVLSRQHMLMLGPPGTAKSMLAKEVCRRIGGAAYFEWLLTKFTTPEEIFGAELEESGSPFEGCVSIGGTDGLMRREPQAGPQCERIRFR